MIISITNFKAIISKLKMVDNERIFPFQGGIEERFYDLSDQSAGYLHKNLWYIPIYQWEWLSRVSFHLSASPTSNMTPWIILCMAGNTNKPPIRENLPKIYTLIEVELESRLPFTLVHKSRPLVASIKKFLQYYNH